MKKNWAPAEMPVTRGATRRLHRRQLLRGEDVEDVCFAELHRLVGAQQWCTGTRLHMCQLARDVYVPVSSSHTSRYCHMHDLSCRSSSRVCHCTACSSWPACHCRFRSVGMLTPRSKRSIPQCCCHMYDHSCCSSWHSATAQPAVVGKRAAAVWVCRHVDTVVHTQHTSVLL